VEIAGKKYFLKCIPSYTEKLPLSQVIIPSAFSCCDV
jgi:hypothetical protein